MRFGTVIGWLRQIGYARLGCVWIVGEDLRWSAPDTSSPGQVVQAWMDSAIHLMYLLKPGFDGLEGNRWCRGHRFLPAPCRDFRFCA